MKPSTSPKNPSKTEKEKVVVIGMGYVGFPLAVAISLNNKYDVYGLDKDKEKVDKLNKKLPAISDEYAEANLKNARINATTDSSVLKNADYIIVCVPTPVTEDKRPDLTPIKQATDNIAKYLSKGQTIIIESTINPGVCEECVLPILEATGMRGGTDFELAHCPERINPGDPVWNVHNIPRNVGALTPEGTKRVADFYRSFLGAKVNEVSSIKVAEATKIVENTFRDVNIAYVNELAKFCDKMGIDVVEVINGSANKPFAFMPHYPGCGVGGHCIPVDPYYLIEKAEEMDLETSLIKTAREVNHNMPKYTVRKLVNALNGRGIDIKKAPVGILGLSYKANTGDMRESPSFEIKKELLRLGAAVICYDPYLNGKSDATLEFILENCAAIVIATNHAEFIEIKDWGNVKVIIDGRNCLDMSKIGSGVIYEGIGRKKASSGIYEGKERRKLHPGIIYEKIAGEE